MLILEIILTIVAWNKGWRWLSLIPLATAFFIGVCIGLSGGTVDMNVIFIDILAVVALIIMSFTKPKETPTNSPPTIPPV
jgi:hypothetical protein